MLASAKRPTSQSSGRTGVGDHRHAVSGPRSRAHPLARWQGGKVELKIAAATPGNKPNPGRCQRIQLSSSSPIL